MGACDSMVLGGLIRELSAKGIFPFPRKPFQQVCLSKFYNDLPDLNIDSLCNSVKFREAKRSGMRQSIGLQWIRTQAACLSSVRRELQAIAAEMRDSRTAGLDLKQHRSAHWGVC